MAQDRSKQSRPLSCPSAPALDEGAQVFGVVVGGASTPQVAYLERPVRLTDEVRALADGLKPSEVFRMVGRCVESTCVHFSGSHCELGERIAAAEAPSDAELPSCSIRAHCRWFAEQQVAACLRCPQIVTDVPVAVPVAPQRAAEKRRRHLKLI